MDEKVDDVVARFGSNLRHLMAARAVSARQLADASSVGLVEIERLMEGEGELFADTLFVLAGALEVEPRELAAGIDWIPGGGGTGEWRIDAPDG